MSEPFVEEILMKLRLTRMRRNVALRKFELDGRTQKERRVFTDEVKAADKRIDELTDQLVAKITQGEGEGGAQK